MCSYASVIHLLSHFLAQNQQKEEVGSGGPSLSPASCGEQSGVDTCWEVMQGAPRQSIYSRSATLSQSRSFSFLQSGGCDVDRQELFI